MPCDDPVLDRYERVARINDRVMAALEADVPGPELMHLLAAHRAAMTDLAETEAQHPPDDETIPARLAGAKTLKAQVAEVQNRLEQKSRNLVRQQEKARRTRQALDAYAEKK